jgi:hypothetical protein
LDKVSKQKRSASLGVGKTLRTLSLPAILESYQYTSATHLSGPVSHKESAV